ncbi:1-deoxy-D-xylulose-5-phosphate reductoisomerase [Synoicihabitans lomoniglobus]|uniref:1-deoxy-D-xylulose 5-phosphate reductoisomerase n=1 Tax=Synoicihabitans lomoniglobus TaxID=2909285 RepID=A0AAE9ZUH5_9BACT|nr:1-deoxy-D-xylulose-5-phosphate reductoisomerase [Opitutaceae bacterium LMO-M01]WED63536.1 1-deoxy-D-xylulose-5-phosphate reductoisomerase [Opitutaceae bacterium LMO-M01]
MRPTSPKRVALLGATGSIGESALRVIAAHPAHLELVAVAAQTNHAELAAISHRFPSVRHATLFDADAYAAAKAGQAFRSGVDLHAGLAGLNTLATLPEADIVLVAVVGVTGLEPALAAINAGKDLALASKEILVMAGKFVMAAARERGITLRPVDSEHNAVAQCLADNPTKDVARIILTASGGAFRDRSLAELGAVTPADALQHPNWSMGPKITVDSATLANKGLELIEAQWLFDLRPEQCQAVLHSQSLAHCLVEFTDGAMLTHLCPPSMTFPIQHALLHPLRLPSVEPSLDVHAPFSLDFRPIDQDRFPMLRLALEAMKRGGIAPAAFNAANEIAVAAFLSEQIPFLAIPRIVEQALSRIDHHDPSHLDAVIAADAEARRLATSLLTSHAVT